MRKKRAPRIVRFKIPTLALPKSGLRVETDSLLSAGFFQLPVFKHCYYSAWGERMQEKTEELT